MMDYSQAREAASRAAAAHTASAFQASLHHGSAGVVTRAQFERVVFDSAISRTLLNTETLRHLLRGGLNCVKLGTRSWARAYIGETLSRHVTALHWLADDEELRSLRRDRSQVILHRSHIVDVVAETKRPDCLTLHVLKDGEPTTRTFSLHRKLRDALYHVLACLVFPDRETQSARNLVGAEIDEDRDLRRRQILTPRHAPPASRPEAAP